jgi:hypothetical protein
MSSSFRGRTATTRETSPERTKVWTEPKPKTPRKVSVVYYISRNGHLEHPHFMEVPLSDPHGLYLKGTHSHSSSTNIFIINNNNNSMFQM